MVAGPSGGNGPVSGYARPHSYGGGTGVLEDPPTDWFTPGGFATGVALAERPRPRSAADLMTVTTEDVLEVLGPDADDLLTTAQVDIDQLIGLLNAETMILPVIVDEPEDTATWA